jgi:cysteine desulfurase
MPDHIIYLDHNASTPCDPRVVEAMAPYLTAVFANPASRTHGPGREAALALESARERVAALLGASSATEIVFTSGATEGNNLALAGVTAGCERENRHLVTQATEHPSVLEPLRQLARRGWEVAECGVGADGRVSLDAIATALRDDTVLLSLMLANNETGTVQPVAAAAELAADRGIPVHCDAAQAVGKIPVDVRTLGIDLLTISGHKIYAPKGIGCLYVRRRRPPVIAGPQMLGGGHEHGLRSGTPNVPGAVALAHALEIAVVELEEASRRTSALRDRFEAHILSSLDRCAVNGCRTHRLPGTTNISFAGIDGGALLASLPDLAVSSGAACTTGHPEASPVLRAMNVPPDLARASLRIGLGRWTTEDEVDRAAARIVEEVSRLRKLERPVRKRRR